MGRKWALLAVASLASLWLASGMAYAEEGKGKAEAKTAGNIVAEFVTPPDGTVVGENQITLQLRDAATGRPIVPDSVRVEFTMDESDRSMQHGDMSQQKPVAVKLAGSKDAPGKYTGKADLTSAGDWKARVIVDLDGVQRALTFGVRVSGSGPNWLIVGGLLAIVVAAIGGVVVMRRKAASGAAARTAAEPAQP